jgi:hypothetical protein
LESLLATWGVFGGKHLGKAELNCFFEAI